MTKDELLKQYENINLALISVDVYLRKSAEASAFLYGSASPEYSPLIQIVESARTDLTNFIDALASE